MFKNVRKKIIYIGVFIILLIIGLVIYSENIKKINIIENIKKAIGEENSSNTTDEITTIDITGITAGKETEHEHIYKTMYNENKHWEECKACGEKINEENHTITTTWSMGYESCDNGNSYTSACSCGYSKSGQKPCVWDGNTYYKDSTMRIHARLCKACNKYIVKPYYLYSYGNGELQNEKYNFLVEQNGTQFCHNINKNQIKCGQIGQCIVCKQNYTTNEEIHRLGTQNGKIVCRVCGKEFGTNTTTATPDENTPPIYTVVQHLILTNGAKFNRIEENILSYNAAVFEDSSQTVSKKSDTDITITTKIRMKSGVTSRASPGTGSHIYINGKSIFYENYFTIYPDLIKPTISNINLDNNSLDEWSKVKRITITGTENYCPNVTVQIIDDNGETIFKGNAIVNNKTYITSCILELEIGLEEKTFKAIVTDTCGNQTEQEFTISKIDGIAPTVTSSNKVTSSEWAREKSFTFTAEDIGIGEVQIGFNDINDYSLAVKDGTTYSKQYKFVGDVYTPVNASVYFKDGLGNVTTQTVTLEKIDGTAPTITKANIHNNKLNIQSHDRNKTLGEGSGVSKYKYITATTKLENPEITSENSTEVNINETITIPDIYKVKYIYVIAEDLVRKHK